MTPADSVLQFVTVFCLLVVRVSGDRSQMQEDARQVSEFYVKPGAGSQQFQQKKGEFTCSFTYKAQGGTHEKWEMALTHNTDMTEWACYVERPSGISYLFFEEFRMEVGGADLQEVVVQSEPGRDLKNDEYKIVKNENYVQQSDGKFESKLYKAEVYAVRGKTEL